MGQFDPARLNTDPAERARYVAAVGVIGSLEGAAKATGIALSTVFRRRRVDAAFADECDAGLARRRGFRLEAALVDRAINGVKRKRTYKDKSVEEWVEFDTRLAIFMISKLKPERFGPLAGTGAALPPPVMSREEFTAIIDARPDGPEPPAEAAPQ